MKYLLILLLTIQFAYGHNDTLPYKIISQGLISFDSISTKKHDTVRCLMLISINEPYNPVNEVDTCKDCYHIANLFDENKEGLIRFSENEFSIGKLNFKFNNTFSVYGYHCIDYNNNWRVKYLDKNLKPLSKNITVWMSKTISN